MLRLYDPGTGQAQTVRPARPGELRSWIAGPASAQPEGMRPALIADLVRRAAERHHLRVSAWHRAPGPAGGASAAELRAAWAALNIHPAEFAEHPPGPVDVAITWAGERDGPAAAHRLRPDPVRPGPVRPGPVQPGPAQSDPARTAPARTARIDPLAVRLALLMVHYREPAEVTEGTLELAGRTLAGLRRQVAGWARSPSAPMCAQYVGDVLGAFDNDLDTPAALLALAALADDPQIPPGSKFEAFAYLDQMFGLDLARDVGR